MNILTKRSFPEFYQSYAPKLLEFYSSWLDWTDLKDNAQYVINHLSTEQDIDESIDAYKTHLKNKYLNDFPEKMVIDLKLLLKNVLYLYRAKSSKKAYDFLFRVLFDSPAKLWYPRENILKTSDGRWTIPCYISFDPILYKKYEGGTNKLITSNMKVLLLDNSLKAKPINPENEYFNPTDENYAYNCTISKENKEYKLSYTKIMTVTTYGGYVTIDGTEYFIKKLDTDEFEILDTSTSNIITTVSQKINLKNIEYEISENSSDEYDLTYYQDESVITVNQKIKINNVEYIISQHFQDSDEYDYTNGINTFTTKTTTIGDTSLISLSILTNVITGTTGNYWPINGNKFFLEDKEYDLVVQEEQKKTINKIIEINDTRFNINIDKTLTKLNEHENSLKVTINNNSYTISYNTEKNEFELTEDETSSIIETINHKFELEEITYNLNSIITLKNINNDNTANNIKYLVPTLYNEITISNIMYIINETDDGEYTLAPKIVFNTSNQKITLSEQEYAVSEEYVHYGTSDETLEYVLYYSLTTENGKISINGDEYTITHNSIDENEFDFTKTDDNETETTYKQEIIIGKENKAVKCCVELNENEFDVTIKKYTVSNEQSENIININGINYKVSVSNNAYSINDTYVSNGNNIYSRKHFKLSDDTQPYTITYNNKTPVKVNDISVENYRFVLDETTYMVGSEYVSDGTIIEIVNDKFAFGIKIFSFNNKRTNVTDGIKTYKVADNKFTITENSKNITFTIFGNYITTGEHFYPITTDNYFNIGSSTYTISGQYITNGNAYPIINNKFIINKNDVSTTYTISDDYVTDGNGNQYKINSNDFNIEETPYIIDRLNLTVLNTPSGIMLFDENANIYNVYTDSDNTQKVIINYETYTLVKKSITTDEFDVSYYIDGVYETKYDDIVTDDENNVVDNAYLLTNCQYYRIVGNTSKSISYLEQATNFSDTVRARDENGNIVNEELDTIIESSYEHGQSAISITSSTGWFYPGETVTITNPDTGEVLTHFNSQTGEYEPLCPVVQWYAETKGHYTSNKGFLSDINCIQDNHYYQNYSYVVQSYVGIRYWRDIVKKLLHPAGLGFFGEMLMSGDLTDGDGIYYYKDIDGREKTPDETYVDYVRKFYLFFKQLMNYSVNLLDYIYDENGHIICDENGNPKTNAKTKKILGYDENGNEIPCEDENDENAITLTYFNTPMVIKRNYLAQTRSIITDIWLMSEMLENGDFANSSSLYPLYPDIKISDLTPYLNRNSVLMFRDLGTLIDPEIIDWRYLGFTENIDEPFVNSGNIIDNYKTKDIYGVTLRPEYDAIFGEINNNYYQVKDDETIIPDNYLVFISSSNENSLSRVGSLNIENEFRDYTQLAVGIDNYVKQAITDTYAKKYGINEIIKTRWGTLVTDDFIYTSSETNRVFNEYSMVKIPDEYINVDNENNQYKFIDNAYVNEKIRIFNYANNDFLYKIWIERKNYDVTVKITFFDTRVPNKVKNIKDLWKKFFKNQILEFVSYSFDNSVEGKITVEYKLKTPSNRMVTIFDVELPEYIEDDRIMLFTNGLLDKNFTSTKSKNRNSRLSINTVDNENIIYQVDKIEFGELTLDDVISVTESNVEEFGEFTLPDIMLLYDNKYNIFEYEEKTHINSIKKEEVLKNICINDMLMYIVSSNTSIQKSYVELYVLSHEEAPTPRMLRYPYYPDIQEIYPENGSKRHIQRYMFTYDNLRLMPFVPHYSGIKRRVDTEIAPDKESLVPKSHTDISWFSIFDKQIRITYHNAIKKENPAQNHSELLDMILDRFNYNGNSEYHADPGNYNHSNESTYPNNNYDNMNNNSGTVLEFTKNYDILATTNKSSTLIFDENGNKVHIDKLDWSRKLINNTPGRKLYSVPINSTKVVEKFYQKENVLQSSSEYYKSKNAFIFIDRIEEEQDENGNIIYIKTHIKVLDTDITYDDNNYRYIINKKYFSDKHKKYHIEVHNFGDEYLTNFNDNTGSIVFENTDYDWGYKGPQLEVTVNIAEEES